MKDAHAAKDFASIDTAQAELQTAWNAASEEMYKASQEAGASQEASQGEASAQDAADHVTDVDFEEVKEDDKK